MAAVGLAVLLSGCTAGPDADGEPSREPSADGALVVLTEPGSKGAYAPSKTPYYYTQGFLICRDDSAPADAVPVLRSVSFNTEVEPLDVKPVIRRIPEERERTGPPDGWTPNLDAIGKPGSFDTPVLGDFSDDFDGTEVTVSCGEAAESGSAKMELEVVMKVPKAGADIDGFTIRYDVDDQRHEVHVPWRIFGCGTKIDRELCSPG